MSYRSYIQRHDIPGFAAADLDGIALAALGLALPQGIVLECRAWVDLFSQPASP